MIQKLKGLLIEDWKRAWKFLTIWLAGALFFIDSALDSLPLIKQYVPDGWVKWMALTIIVARLIKQQGWVNKTNDDRPEGTPE